MGLARATFTAWPTTVAIAIPSAIAAAITNGIGVSAIRWSKPFSQSRIIHQATGQAMTLAMITGPAELPHEQLNDVASPRAEHLADADFLGPPLRGERGESEQAEAADDHREQREGREDLRPRILLLVQLADDVLAELGVERHFVGDLLPLPLDRRPSPSPGSPLIADDHPAGPGVTLWNIIGSIGVRTDAEARVADDADDGDVHDPGVVREQLAPDDLADRILRRFEAQLAAPHIR